MTLMELSSYIVSLETHSQYQCYVLYGFIVRASEKVEGVQLVTHSSHTLPIQDCLVLFVHNVC